MNHNQIRKTAITNMNCALLRRGSAVTMGELMSERFGRGFRRFVGALLTALACCSGVTLAQDAPSQDTSQGGLQEIIVTATRREQSVEKVPISIVALGQEELTDRGIKSIADLSEITPGLQFTAPTGYASDLSTISIRGLNSYTGASTVGIYLDDTPIQARLSVAANAGSPYPFVFDLNRVEVARGPQGTLFGAGSEAGTLRFITNQPSLTESSGFTTAELSSTQDGAPSYELGAAYGGPIIPDTLGFRVSAWHREDGGYLNLVDPATGQVTRTNVNSSEKTVFRGAFTLAPGDGIEITPSIDYQKTHIADGDRFYGNYFSNPSQDLFADGRLAPEASDDAFVLGNVKVVVGLPFADFTSNTSVLHRVINISMDLSPLYCPAFGGCGNPLGPDFAESPANIAPGPAGQRLRAVTQEFRLASNDQHARVTWVAGLFYDHRVQEDWQVISATIVDPTGAPIYNIDQRVTDDQLAFYAQADVHITSQLTATLGDRVSRVKADTDVAFGSGALDVGLPALTSSAQRETPTTPRIALSYQANQNNLFYAAYSKGFRVGGGNAALGAYCNFNPPTTYSSDDVLSYEVGAKNKLFDGRVQLDTSVFHIKWNGVQQLLYLPCFQAYTANSGNAVSNGFDLALNGMALT
jgi:iron complex outermembrane recepter protein